MFVFAACSPAPAGSAAAPSGSGAAAAQPEVCKNKKGTSANEIHVYSSLPRQGSNTDQTNALVESIKEILDGKTVGSFTIKYTDLDDSSAANNGDWDGAVAQQNATTAANDPDAMVFIGHFNSGAAKLTIPILNAACLVMISPANTYPGLTTAVEGVTEPGEPDSYYPNGYRNYSRVISTDNKQGGAGAAWAKELGATKAYVLDDTQVYGKGLARSWALSANQLGIEVVSASGTSEGFDAKATDYAALAQKIKDSGADFIYIGSITGQNTGKLWKDLRAAMPDMKIMSGDGVFEESWYDGHRRGWQQHVPDLRRRRSERADLGRRQEVGRRLQGGTRRRRSARLRHLRCGRGPARAGRPHPRRDQRPLRSPQAGLLDHGLRFVPRHVLHQAGRRHDAGRGDRLPGRRQLAAEVREGARRARVRQA